VAAKPDSQDICFVPTGSYAAVVEKLRPGATDPGDIVDLAGNVLGRHDGIIHYTVGQRRGLGISGGQPLYVVRLESETRRVVVGPAEALLTGRLSVREVNWLGEGEGPSAVGIEVSVKLRSTQPLTPATVFGRPGGTAEVVLDTPPGRRRPRPSLRLLQRRAYAGRRLERARGRGRITKERLRESGADKCRAGSRACLVLSAQAVPRRASGESHTMRG
jgi:tRNA-specific 2-thiouridylase